MNSSQTVLTNQPHFSKKQLTVLKFPYQHKYNVLIADGAVRSGKTASISLSFVTSNMDKYNNQAFIIGAQSTSTAWKNLIKPLVDMRYMRDNYEMKYRGGSTQTFTVTRGNVTNTFYIFGGNNERSQDAVQGLTAAGCLLDEVALMPESFVNQCIARLSVDGALLFFTCNPRHPNHWFYQDWILKHVEKKALYLRFTMKDNPGLSEERKGFYRSMFSGVFFKRNILGMWVNAEGSIYTTFSENKDKYLIDKPPKDIVRISCGMDFGGTKSGHTFVCVGITKGAKKVIVLESWRVEGGIDTEVLDNKFSAFCQLITKKYHTQFVMRCDSAEQVLIRGFKKKAVTDRLAVTVKNAKKTSIMGRILMVERLFKQERLFLVKDTTRSLQDALDGAIWKDNKGADPEERLDNGTSDIDTMDAFEYSIEEYFSLLEKAVYK